MKATLSADGEMRFTIRLRMRVAAEDLINAIGWKIVRERQEFDGNIAVIVKSELKAFRSRRAILIAFREATLSEGYAIWTWPDGQNEEFVREVKEKARVLLQKKFPSLFVVDKK